MRRLSMGVCSIAVEGKHAHGVLGSEMIVTVIINSSQIPTPNASVLTFCSVLCKKRLHTSMH